MDKYMIYSGNTVIADDLERYEVRETLINMFGSSGHDFDDIRVVRYEYIAIDFSISETESEWIEWGGGECPVDANQLVDLRFRDGGVTESTTAWIWGWGDTGTSSDIVAYRVIK